MLSGKPARLMLRSLLVVARHTQWPQVLRRIGIRFAPRNQLPSTQREMIGDIRSTTTQHAPRMAIEVHLAYALPTRVVAASPRCTAVLLLSLSAVLVARPTIGQRS